MFVFVKFVSCKFVSDTYRQHADTDKKLLNKIKLVISAIRNRRAAKSDLGSK